MHVDELAFDQFIDPSFRRGTGTNCTARSCGPGCTPMRRNASRLLYLVTAPATDERVEVRKNFCARSVRAGIAGATL